MILDDTYRKNIFINIILYKNIILKDTKNKKKIQSKNSIESKRFEPTTCSVPVGYLDRCDLHTRTTRDSVVVYQEKTRHFSKFNISKTRPRSDKR